MLAHLLGRSITASCVICLMLCSASTAEQHDIAYVMVPILHDIANVLGSMAWRVRASTCMVQEGFSEVES